MLKFLYNIYRGGSMSKKSKRKHIENIENESINDDNNGLRKKRTKK